MSRQLKEWRVLIVLLALLLIVVTLSEMLSNGTLFKNNCTSESPNWVVTTLNDEASESRAFTWHNYRPKEASIVQVVKGTDTDIWNGTNPLSFTGDHCHKE